MDYEDKQSVKAIVIMIGFVIVIVFIAAIGGDIYKKTYGSKSLEAVKMLTLPKTTVILWKL